MSPRLRKAALTVHVICSVGLLGAIAAFFALAIVGLHIRDTQLARAPYISMGVIAWTIILPATVAGLITGLVQSLGTRWGLLRHKWVLAKLLVTSFATVILMIKMALISQIANIAWAGPLAIDAMQKERSELAFHAGAGFMVLLAPMVLSVFKPWGLTGYGLRKKNEAAAIAAANGRQQ